MTKKVLAIANYRVSSDEQLLSNSLARQEMSVSGAADRLNAEIVRDWSGSVSSKAGTNVKRKDLLEMLEFCKTHKNIKYAIFDEYDRFMRSVNEGPYFEVLFEQLGVKVWYASETDAFNGNDAMAKFMRSMSAYKAEGSNEERQRKSIAGQTAALKMGRYPFSPKPGYKRGYERGIQEIHPVRGPALRDILIKIASYQITPSQGLVELNKSDFVKGHSLYKMDKFRKIVTDPFYAGIVEIDKQVKFRNEDGLHDALISKDQHNELLKIMNGKAKNQKGPRKNGNPKYPGNNITVCNACLDEKNGKFVGFDHGNGHSSTIYERYRCRTCNRCLTRQELHEGIEMQFKDNPIVEGGVEDFIEALGIVWKRRQGQAGQEASRLRNKIRFIQEGIDNQVEAATDPSNTSIKEEILIAIDKKRTDVTILEDEIERINNDTKKIEERFLRFAFNFADTMGKRFLDPSLSQENRLRCKQIMFPAGFYVNTNKKVYTPEKSLLITLAAMKKDTEVSDNSHLVRVRGL